MNTEERIPLVRSTSKQADGGNGNDGYLLLSMPNSENSFVKRLNNLGNHAGVITGVIVVVVIIVLIAVITYFADVKELVNRGRGSNAPLHQEYSPLMEASLEISTPLGAIKGYPKESRQGREYHAFYKVPYAKPPIGKLRFKDTQPAEKWEGVRDFNKVAPECIQKTKYSFGGGAATTATSTGVEDCLYSNIYIPNVPNMDVSTLNFPVMVYIHGGGFGNGNGSRYGADYFMDENVILVTFQYRLGLLGFFNTGDREATGNMAFKDQVMLLRWVKEYIKYFGGDPTRVTIFGNSSGGFSVSFLVISPMTSGLVSRAISQSGVVLSEPGTIIDAHPERTKKAVAQAFNCSEKSEELVTCLQNVDAADLVVLRSSEIMFGLTIESGFDPNDLSNVFMPEQPYSLLKSGKVNPIPYLIGIMSTEWIGMSLATLASTNATALINSNFRQTASKILGMNLTAEESELIRRFYFGDKEIGLETERNLTNLLSDRMMVHPSKVVADFHSSSSEGAAAYLFYFSKDTKQSYSERLFELFPNFEVDGVVSHADEIQFLFPYDRYPFIETTDNKYFPFSEFLVKLWSHFGATGRVDLNAETELWSPVDPESQDISWFELNDHPKLTNVLQSRMNFWDQFSPETMGYA